MKKGIKLIRKNLLGLIIGIVVGGITLTFADKILSRNVDYNNTNSSKYGATATNVEEALNELYEKAQHVGECPSGYECKGISGYLPANDTNTYPQSTFVENLTL